MLIRRYVSVRAIRNNNRCSKTWTFCHLLNIHRNYGISGMLRLTERYVQFKRIQFQVAA